MTLRTSASSERYDAAAPLRPRFAFRRWVMLVVGLFLLALGFVLTLKSRLGLNPWNVFHHGLTFHLPITWGQSNMLVGVAILGVAYALGAELGAGTIGNMVLTGLFMDAILASGVVPDFLRAR
ncbi:MAG: hypothetical protein FJX78_04240, partial [Armatimonadetes bacterium]|nr:hypothetical protein [Armatimonadota bacterium]